MSYCTIQSPYPPAAAGEKRVIFALDPHTPEEERQQYMLQLIPGRVVTMSKTEAANIQMLRGKLEKHKVEGSDARYYHVKLGGAEAIASTMMAVPNDDGVKVRKFVPMSNPPLLPYSSAYPVVAYLPQDAELHYSVWNGSDEMPAASS